MMRKKRDRPTARFRAWYTHPRTLRRTMLSESVEFDIAWEIVTNNARKLREERVAEPIVLQCGVLEVGDRRLLGIGIKGATIKQTARNKILQDFFEGDSDDLG